MFLAGAMAFAAGIMIFISLYEIIGKSEDGFTTAKMKAKEDPTPRIFALLSFALGFLITYFIEFIVDKIMPESHKEVEKFNFDDIDAHVANMESQGDELASKKEESDEDAPVITEEKSKTKLVRTGIITAIAIGIHNIPEGMITFFGVFENWRFAASLAFAIAMHNIPEGLCVAVPIYFATGSKRKAIFWTSISAITEPIGGLIAWGIVKATGNPLAQSAEGNVAIGLMFGIVAGMMTFIVINELLPAARQHDPENKVTTHFTFLGMLVMGLSIYLFEL